MGKQEAKGSTTWQVDTRVVNNLHRQHAVEVLFSSPRCGLMLTIATNLLLWLLAVTNDTIHMEIESQLREVEQRFAGKAPFSHPYLC